MKINFLFIVLFQIKNAIFSDQFSASSSEVSPRGQRFSLVTDQRLLRLRDFAVKNKYNFCFWAHEFRHLDLFNDTEQKQCFYLYQSLKSKYLTVKTIFLDAIGNSFEITDSIVKNLDELNEVI